MKTTTKIGAGAVVTLLGVALLTSRNWTPFPFLDGTPMTSKVRPSTSDGRFIKLRGTWEEGVAFITITAGDGVTPPGCKSMPCGENPYNERIQVKHGQEVVFSVQATSYKGRATCLLLALGEDFGSKIPDSARREATTGGDVTCTRTVTW